MIDRFRVKPDKLRWVCDPAKLGFETTDQLKELAGPIGQSRAVDALEFGVNIRSDGYNVFVMGPVGTGRMSTVRETLARVAEKLPPAPDLCFVYNFQNPDAPIAISLPAGEACRLRDNMEELVEDVRRDLTSAFESEEYLDRREDTVRDFREKRQEELAEFEKEAQAAGMVVGRGPAGIIVAPAKDGEVMSPQEYADLPNDERKVLDEKRVELQEKLNDILRRHHREEKKTRAEVKKLDQEQAKFAIGHIFEELRQAYADYPKVLEYLQHVEQDVVQHVDALREHEEEHAPEMPLGFQSPSVGSRFDLYRVNVLLSCDPEQGAPVVYEPNPTIDNLTGKIEHRSQMGALVTDFTMIRPGALHRANGGYLVLDADSLLRKPYAWEALKRALKNHEIRIESLADQLRFMATVTLEPEPVPVDLKVVLVGTPYLYYLMYAYDDDFPKLFKVKADFDTSTPRSARTVKQYARFIATLCNKENLRHFTAPAAALVIEHAARLTADQMRLSTRFMEVADLVRQAAYWCSHNGHEYVRAEDVRRALREHTQRSNRIEERLQEMVDRGFIFLDTSGAKVGQVNGLSVIPLGDYWFGRPGRITARTYPGKSGVMQIDREAKLTGHIHDKGVLILGGFLNARYGDEAPLALSASITFEQTYDTVDGDSASSTELYAVLSSLADVAIKQSIAVTGSVNQLGEIQPIGGVNEKIEGFFRACKSRGLTGDQGVLIPKANLPHLALDHEVIEAVEAGEFHLYAVSDVDEGMEVLTGLKMGRRGRNGKYPNGTINRKVADTLARYSSAVDGGNGDSSDEDDEDGE